MLKNPAVKQKKLKGSPLSPGIAIGRPYFHSFDESTIQQRDLDPDQVEKEVLWYRQALEKAKSDMQVLLNRMEAENALEAVTILETHIQIMSDPLLTSEVEDAIRKEKKNASFLFYRFVQQYQTSFGSISDAFFRERAQDLCDITRRILRYLSEQNRICLSEVPPESIIFSDDFSAADIAEAKTSSALAFITKTGSSTSHAAIMAKAKGVPCVGNMDEFPEEKSDSFVIVDGTKGEVIFHPTQKTIDEYRDIQKKIEQHYKEVERIGKGKAETKDGVEIRLAANLELASELNKLHKYGGSGVGLFRSEYLILSKQSFPSEAVQFRAYKKVAERMQGLPVVIRTFDVGGDKQTEDFQSSNPGNPYLGSRAIRFLLKEKEIFKAQLRAIIRASAFGDIHILFPMVTTVDEVKEAKKLIREVKKELRAADIPFAKKIPIGCMIEVPAAALIADHLAEECDFLSIGTNDLIQYCLAADRSYQEKEALRLPAHPSMLRLIRHVVVLAEEKNVPVSICGEIAADPRFTALLIGLGVQELSVSLRYLPLIKLMIRNTTMKEAKNLAKKVLNMSSSDDISRLLIEHHKNAPETGAEALLSRI